MITEGAMRRAVAHGDWLGSDTVPTWTGVENEAVPTDLAVDSYLLRTVMLGIDPARHPYGLMLRGLVIVGDLELSDLTIDYRIRWRRCRFMSTVDMENTRFRRIALGGCRFDKTLYADRLIVSGAAFFSDNDRGPGKEPFRAMQGLRLAGAQLASLTLAGAYLGRDKDGRSLFADGLKIDGAAKLGSGTDPLTARGNGASGRCQHRWSARSERRKPGDQDRFKFGPCRAGSATAHGWRRPRWRWTSHHRRHRPSRRNYRRRAHTYRTGQWSPESARRDDRHSEPHGSPTAAAEYGDGHQGQACQRLGPGRP